MAEDGPADEAPVTFNIRSSQDTKYTVTIPLSHTVQQLKEKLSGEDYANLPPERQRLIYSGRVLKDADTLASYKIKEGNTVHLVKGAASNERQNPANQGASVGGRSGQANPAVPTNLSSGPGANNPLAGLTGARYAGLAHLPNQSMFGPDGGMGPPPDPEQIIQLLENPQFASTLNEALSNPQIVETMIQQNPMLREMGPEMRQMMQSPEFRRFMTDPQMLRSTMQMQRAFGGNPFGPRPGNTAFPAPGATDTTPAGAQASDGAESQGGQGQQGQQQQQQPPMNPFAMLGGAGGQAGNPFAQIFNPGAFGGAQGGAGQGNSGSGSTTGTGQAQQPGSPPAQGAYPNPLFNPGLMARMLNMSAAQQQAQQSRNAGGTTTAGGPGAPTGGNPGANTTGGSDGTSPNRQQQQQPVSNPFAALLGMLGDPSAGGGAGSPGQGGGANPYGFNPFAFPGAFGGYGGGAAGSPPPQDNRPPEERYAEQLRQLNEMGFYEFERNVEALRRSGGSVQGALEYLLPQPPS